jgi:predicted component of type VI protein secretion system
MGATTEGPGAGGARLYVLSGPDVARSFALGARAVLGRSDECDVVLADRSISRKHAVLERAGDGWTLQDLGSTNGISKGGRRAERIELADGDEFKLGDLSLRLKRAAAAEEQDIEFDVGPRSAAAPPAPAPAPAPPLEVGGEVEHEIEIEEEIHVEDPAAPGRKPPGSARAERRTGFLAGDLEQSPFWVRVLVFLAVLAAGAGVAWGAFRVVQMLRAGLG